MVYRLADLRAQIAWFNRLRAVAALGVTLIAAVAAHVFAVLDDPRPLYVLAAITLAVDAAYVASYPKLQRAREQSLRRHVDLQIAIDLALLTAMLHFSGGVTNPFLLFFLFHTFIASLLLSVRAALLVAGVSTLLVAALGYCEYGGLIAHHPIGDGFLDLRESSPLAITVMVGVFGATLFISAYFLGTILRQLTRREEELGGLRRQLGQREKLTAIGTLAAGVAHEINNPMGVIKNKVEILRHRIDDGDDQAALRRELDTIDKHLQRVGNITHGLLTFSKETPFELRPLPVNGLIREAIDLVRVPFRAAEVVLVEKLAADDPEVLGSGNHLLQVLINILLNARDASPPGTEVVVASRRRGRDVAIEIRDHGGGIAAEHLPQIFDPFFTTKDVDKGTGLGLAISHGIVERHGGRIEVESEPDRGARFVVVLPGRGS